MTMAQELSPSSRAASQALQPAPYRARPPSCLGQGRFGIQRHACTVTDDRATGHEEVVNAGARKASGVVPERVVGLDRDQRLVAQHEQVGIRSRRHRSKRPAAETFGDRMDFVHLEVWNDFEGRALNKEAAEWIYQEGADPKEPWVFLVAADGSVAARWDNVATDDELEAAVQGAVSG